MRRRVVVSRRCTNVWIGEACGLCMSAEQGEGRGGRGACMGPLVLTETWEQETHAPHFLSPLYQHLALCYFCALKASDESLATDKCLCLLVFLWASHDWLYPPAPLLLSLFCSIPVSALRCHKKSYSLWFTLRFPRDGFWDVWKDNGSACSSKGIYFYKTLEKRHECWLNYICPHFVRNNYFHVFIQWDLGNKWRFFKETVKKLCPL